MDNSIKKFKCDRCNKFHYVVTWKSYEGKGLFMCDKCWKINDLLLNNEILEKLKKLKLIN